MEQVTGFEPVSSAWQAEILTIILYLHIESLHACFTSVYRTTRKLHELLDPATGVEPATYWLQISCAANCATPAEKEKEFGEQFQSHASSMELHNLSYAQRTSGARATELVLRVFHWWGRYCLHLTFNACLRTHGPRYRIRTGPICLEGRDASRWHQSRIWRFLSQPLYKYYITIFKKNQIFTFQNLQIGVVIWSERAKPTLQNFGAWRWTRTADKAGMNRSLYQLRYPGIRLTSLSFSIP